MAESNTQATFPKMNANEIKANAGKAARLMKSLANENRLTILCTLAFGEKSVGDLNAEVDLSQSSLSQHLGVLRKEGFVETRRESQTIYYSLANAPALEVIGTLHNIFCDP